VKKLLILFAALALVAGFGGVSIAGIQGSFHDFSGAGWSENRICLPCHTPHNADTLVSEAPLWNHEVTTASYQVYSSPTMTASPVNQPTGASKLCLSCHDGTVAVDSFGGNPGAIMIGSINGSADLGTDLSDDHPISFTYDATLATNDGGLFDPTTTNVTIGTAPFTKTGPISDVMLFGGVLQCASCHSVHNDFVVGDEYLLKLNSQGSELCLACHNK